jgi:cell wall-associated NlpC family hydrolase
VRPEDFDPSDPNLGNAPLKPEVMDLHPAYYYDPSTDSTIELSKGTYSSLAEDAYKRYGRYIGNQLDPYNNLVSILSGEGLEPGSNLLVEYGKKFAGKLPYVWGGKKLEEGADCSGFVYSIFNDFGIKIPRGTSMIAKDVDPETVEENADYVPKYEELFIGPGMGNNRRDATEFGGAEEDARELVYGFCEGLQPGDLIPFSLSERNDWVYGDVTHVVMYAGLDDKGNHMIVEEYSTGHDAYYRPIDDLIFGKSHWQTRLPVYGVSYMTSEQRERLTVPEY